MDVDELYSGDRFFDETVDSYGRRPPVGPHSGDPHVVVEPPFTGYGQTAATAALSDPDFIAHLQEEIGEVWPPRPDNGRGQYLIVREIVDNMLEQLAITEEP